MLESIAVMASHHNGMLPVVIQVYLGRVLDGNYGWPSLVADMYVGPVGGEGGGHLNGTTPKQ